MLLDVNSRRATTMTPAQVALYDALFGATSRRRSAGNWRSNEQGGRGSWRCRNTGRRWPLLLSVAGRWRSAAADRAGAAGAEFAAQAELAAPPMRRTAPRATAAT
jgi:hypothetical protein